MRQTVLLIGAVILVFGSAHPVSAQDDHATLRAAVHAKLTDGHTRLGYSATWNALAALYADPAMPGNISLFYTGRSHDVDIRVNQNNQDGWNREHLWPQSQGARREPVKSDLHHLRPADASVNGDRGSLDFDEGGSAHHEAPDTFLDGDSFEPRDDVKGDVARAMFYMDVRYEGGGREPDLVLIDGSAGSGTALGDVCTLLEWHKADPADAPEVAANDLIEQLQGNRNLFVDLPDLADALYGPGCGAALPDLSALLAKVADGQDGSAAVVVPATSARLRLATWNIANFWHVPGEHLRPARDGGPGLIRSSGDYDAIRAAAAALGADIIGLQEMASPASARALFPSSEWDLVFSKRFDDDLAENPDLLESDATRDSYTAIVVRRSAAKVVGTERIELDILDENGFPVREGVAALVDLDGTPVWIASLHLKSGCFTDNDLTARADCRTLARQLPILEEWIDEKSEAGFPVALLGDFNRQLDRGSDIVRADLDDNQPTDLFKVPHRQRLLCQSFQPAPRTSIDYVIVNELLWENVTVPDTPKFDLTDPQISDHCPVFIDIVLEN